MNATELLVAVVSCAYLLAGAGGVAQMLERERTSGAQRKIADWTDAVVFGILTVFWLPLLFVVGLVALVRMIRRRF